MIKKRNFIHQNIKYSFNWNIRNYLEKMNQLNSNREELKKLGSYLKHIYEGSLVPNDIFNTRNIPRVSQFKIRGLKNAFLTSLSKKLIRAGKIKKSDSNSKFPRYVQKVYESYNKNQINRKPGHDSVLKNILIFYYKINSVVYSFNVLQRTHYERSVIKRSKERCYQ